MRYAEMQPGPAAGTMTLGSYRMRVTKFHVTFRSLCFGCFGCRRIPNIPKSNLWHQIIPKPTPMHKLYQIRSPPTKGEYQPKSIPWDQTAFPSRLICFEGSFFHLRWLRCPMLAEEAWESGGKRRQPKHPKHNDRNVKVANT